MRKIKDHQLIISLAAIFVFLALVSVANYSEHVKLEEIQACDALRTNLVQKTFSPLTTNLQAKAFYVYDFSKSLMLYGNNQNLPLPLASLTKLMTIRMTLKNVSPEAFYTIKSPDLDSDGFVGFVAGDTYRIKDLVTAALVASSNDAAVMLAASIGVPTNAFTTAMDAEAQNLQLPTLQYESVTGLDVGNNTIATATGSAHDILMLLYRDWSDFPDLFAVSTHQNKTISATNGRSIALSNTDLAIPKLPQLVASKTGYTITAGGNLAVLWREPGGDLLGASLLGSSEEGRFSDMISIHDAADMYIAVSKAFPTQCSDLEFSDQQ